VQRLGKVNIGETPVEQFKNDLAFEYDALKRLNDGVKLCRDLGDNGSADLLQKILVSEEEHTDWLETQLELVKQLGEANYLTQQIHG
jgi:bacterioferritin